MRPEVDWLRTLTTFVVAYSLVVAVLYGLLTLAWMIGGL